MALIASLDVALRGDTGNLDKALSKSQNNVKQFSDNVSKSGNSVAGSVDKMGSKASVLGSVGTAFMGVAGAVAAAGAAIGAFVASSLSGVANLGRTAQMLGATTAELAGLRQAAVDAGGGQEELDRFLIHLQRSSAEAAMGVGGASNAFNLLGIDAQKFADLPLSEKVGQLAEALKTTGTYAQKLQLLTEIGGRGGPELLNMMLGGQEAIQKGMADAIANGTAVSKEQADEVRKLSAEWKGFMSTLSGLGTQLGIAVLPILKDITGGIKSFADLLKSEMPHIKFFVAELSLDFERWGEKVKQAFDAALLGLISFGASTAYFFTEGIVKAIKGDFEGAFTREWTDAEANILKRIEERSARIANMEKDKQKALADKLRQIEGVAKELPPAPGAPLMATGGQPGAMEITSVQAFSTIAAQQGDKMFAVANAQLQEQQIMVEVLKALLQAYYGNAGQVQAAVL